MHRTFHQRSFLPAAMLCLWLTACGGDQPADSTAAPSATAAAADPAPAAEAAAATANAPAEFAGRVQAAVDQLASELGPEETKRYTDVLAEGGEAPHAGLGLLAFLDQKLELATWLYGLGVLAEPDNDVYLNNFGLGLHEKALLTQPTSQPLLQLAKESFESAIRRNGDNASYHNNLGFVALELWRTDADAATLQAAVDALKRATTLNPKSPTAWAHLAEALAAQKDVAGAADALAKSRELAPFNGALLSTRPRLPAEVLSAYDEKAPAQDCEIDFECKAQCPKSIIGQINFVTCEMEQSSARMACEAGEPYAEGFDCSEQIPEFGILFPGLNSGFSLITPWGRLDFTVDGRGKVNYRFETGPKVGGVGLELGGRGSWSPASGFSSAEIKPGVSFDLVGGDAAKLLEKTKMGPAQINIAVKPSGEAVLEIKAYGGAVLSH